MRALILEGLMLIFVEFLIVETGSLVKERLFLFIRNRFLRILEYGIEINASPIGKQQN